MNRRDFLTTTILVALVANVACLPAQTLSDLQAIDRGPGPTCLADAKSGDRTVATVANVVLATNTVQHSNASGCPMHGRFAFGGMVLTSNPPQYAQDPGHNHPPGALCLPYTPPTERWTVTEVTKTGILRVFDENFPFTVTVSKTTNSHEVLRQEWRAKP